MKHKKGCNLIRYGIWFLVLVIIVIWFLYWKKTQEYFTAESEYMIEEIPNFLSQEECNRIIELSVNNLSQSKLFKEASTVLRNIHKY